KPAAANVDPKAPWLGRHFPNRGHRVLKLPEHACCPDDQTDDADRGRGAATLRRLHSTNDRHNGLGGIISSESGNLGLHLLKSRPLEKEPDHRDEKNKKRRNGKRRVISKRGAKPWGFVFHPLLKCF